MPDPGCPAVDQYARRTDREQRERGPRTELSDGQLTELIRAILDQPLFAGEGYRKVTARLRREYRVFVGRNRVLRLMRQAGVLVHRTRFPWTSD